MLSFPRDILIIFETFAFRLYPLRISRHVKYQIPIKFPTQIYQIACYKFDQIFGGNGNAKIRTKCGKMYVSLALGNFTRRYYPTTVIHEARIDFHEVSNVKKRKKSKEKKERRKRKKRRNARGACIVRELSPPMVF